MKIFTSLHKSNNEGTRIPGLKSRITSTKPLLNHYCVLTVALMLLLGGFSTRAWGGTWYAQINAYSDPSTGGYVYVGTNSSCTADNATATSDWGSNSDSKRYHSSGDINLWLCAKVINTNYVFKGWNTDQSNTVISGSSSVPYKATVWGDNKNFWGNIKDECKYDYYAIFARLTANKSSINTFESVNVGSTSNAQEVKITYVHAGKVTAVLTGDFSFESGSSSQSKTLANDNTNTQVNDQTINIYFKPTCNSTRNGTLTIKGSNGMTDVVISLSGTGVLNDQTLSWNNESSIATDMMNGATQNISATASSGLTVSYESSNTTILSVDANGKLTANAVGGPVTITAKQEGNCTYGEAVSITKTFNVKTKDTPIFIPNGFSEGTTKALKVDDEVTMDVAFVSEGLSGNFTASATQVNNQDVLQITRNGNTITIKALREGTSTATFTQTENSTIFGATKSYTFNVTKVDNTLSPKNNSYTRYVDEDDDLTAFVTTNSNGTIHASSTDDKIAYYDITNNKLVIDNNGNKSFNSTTVTIKIWQDATVKYAGITEANAKTVTLTVKKYEPTFNDQTTYTKLVGETQTANYVYSNVSPTTPTANSTDNFYYTIDNVSFTKQSLNNGGNLITYNPGTKVITACNAGSCDITFHQKETYKYQAKTKSYHVVVNKRANALSCKFDNVTSTTWKKTLNFDEYTVATFSSNHTMNAIQVALKAGDSIASYNPSNGRITASGNVGDAIWTVWQPENYMYVGDTAECKVTVSKKACPTCYVYEGYINDYDKTVGETWNDNPTIASWSEDGVANQLTFSMAVNGAGNNAQFARYVSGTWSSDSTLKTSGYHGIWNYDYDDHSVALNAHTTQLRFMKKNTDNPYIKDIRVSRRKWFTIEDLNGNALSQIEMKNYVGGNSTTAQFRVNFSTCDKEVKVISNHPHVTVSYDPINLDNSKGGSGIRTITITYACDVAERINTTISVYTKYEQADLRVIATTELEDQVINWNSDYVSGKSASLPVSFKSNDMATASSDLDVKYITTTPDIIDISADSTIIQVIKEGENGVLIAYQAGNDVFKPISDTITVHATNKKIQTIVWSQSFTRNLKLDSVCELKAQVYITNMLDGTQTYSAERTAKLHYACTGTAGIVDVNDEAKTMRIVNYGNTHVTATVEDDDDDYETALPVEKQVKIHELSSGDCEGDSPIYESQNDLDIFYFDVSIGNLNTIGMTLAKPQVEKSIHIDLSSGVPDSLKCNVHAVPYVVPVTKKEHMAGYVAVFASSDNGITWTDTLAKFNPTKNNLVPCAIPLDRDVNMVKFVRPEGGEGHHMIEDIVVTRKQFIEAENKDLGTVAAGAIRKDSMLVNYSDARQDFNVARGLANTKNKLILEDNMMYVSCGETDQQKLPFEFMPKVVGDWKDTVTITDPKTGKSASVILTATITRGNQVIKWNADTEIDAGEHAPSLNGYSTAGEDYPVSYAITAGSDVAVIREINGVDSVIVKKSGTFTITATQPGDDNFYPAEPVVKTFTVSSVSYVYNGDGAWNADDNWNTKEVPADGVDVIINGHVTISGAVSVNSMTINEGNAVTLTVGGQLTVGNGNSQDREHYGDLHVEEQGKVILGTGTLKVNDFILDAKLGDIAEAQEGASGQVTNPSSLNINGEVYFDLTLNPDLNGHATYGWYEFTVPFDVNVADGIFRLNDNGTTTAYKAGRDFILARYDEARRAAGQKGWVQMNSGVLNAGEAYTIAVDDEVQQNVLRFVWNKNNSVGASNSCAIARSANGEDRYRGWNGLGNGTLIHRQINELPAETKVQIYDHESNAYIAVPANGFTYAVGTAFFYHALNNDNVVLAQADGERPLRAPQSEGRKVSEFRLTLKAENSNRLADVLYVSASEEATGEYVLGHDLLKMSNPKEASFAQMWAKNADMQLCDIEMPLINSNATCELGLNAPKDDAYVLEVKQAPEDATLYLTYNGRAIWNLNYSPYVLDLTKGMTEGYGLKLYANQAPQVTTGVDEFDAESQTVRKVMIDNTIYIITPDGAMYDVLGKKCE